MGRKVASLLLILALAYAGVCLLLFLRQRSMLYYPQPRAGVAGATLLALDRGDGVQVLASALEAPGEGAVIYLGGNAEDVSWSAPSLRAAFPGQALYLMHYRGYGGSGGSPGEAALFGDAQALYERVHALHPRVTVVGRSLGSGIAVHLASVQPVVRLVLVTPYDSIVGIAAQALPWAPVRWLLRDKYESGKYAPRVSAPTTIIAAANDEVIPLASSQALYRRFPPGRATIHVIPGESHNSISENPAYIPLLSGKD